MAPGAVALVAAGVLIGVLVGSTGLGGVLLVPFLVHGLGFRVQSAVAAALWSYLWSGLLARDAAAGGARHAGCGTADGGRLAGVF